MQKRALMFLLLILVLPVAVQASDLSQNCKEVFPGFNGPANERVNLVFMSFNYKNIDEFLEKVRPLVRSDDENNTFFTFEPVSSNKNKFNLWYINHVEQIPTSTPRFGGDLPLEDRIFYSNGKWRELMKECENIPPGVKVGMVMLNAEFNVKIYSPSDPEQAGFTGNLIIPNTIPTREIQHDFVHAFGKHVDEYSNSGDAFIEAPSNYPNCDTSNSNQACPQWCQGQTVSLESLKKVDCSGFSRDECNVKMGEGSPCFLIQTDGPLGKANSCVNYVNFCSSRTDKDSCKDTTNNFYLFPICSWVKDGREHPYFKSSCVPSGDNLNIGTECIGETGCFNGCGGNGGLFRSTKRGMLMEAIRPLGDYNEKILCDRIQQETGGVGGKCNELFSLFTGFTLKNTTASNNETTTTTLKIFNTTNSTNTSSTPTTLFSSCGATSDSLCPAECSPGSDYDCCKSAGKCWQGGVCNVCSASKPTSPSPSTVLVPTAPNLKAKSNEAGGVFLTWTRSQLIEQQLTGNIVLKRISKSLSMNSITGKLGFIDSIVNFLKGIFGQEEKGINVVSPETQGIRYKVYRNNNLLAEGSDELCSDICQYVDEAGRSGLFSYKVEACLQDSCRDSNEITLEIVMAPPPPKPASPPEEEFPREIPATPATSPNGTDIPPTTPPIITPSLCSTTPDNSCPSACSAGSDYDCCKTAGKCWFYSGVDRVGCYDCNIVTGFCSVVSDGICPSGCAAGADADCCSMAGKCWFSSYGCYDCNQNPGSCTSTEDGLCPSSCTAGSDADCCSQSGMCWIEGKGCAFGFCRFTTSQTTTTPSAGRGGASSSPSTSPAETPAVNETTTTTLGSGTTSSTTSTTTTTSPTSTCETSGDGVCPSACSAGSDYDCCRNKGSCWDWFENNNGCQNTC